jgi:hypothetical protein
MQAAAKYAFFFILNWLLFLLWKSMEGLLFGGDTIYTTVASGSSGIRWKQRFRTSNICLSATISELRLCSSRFESVLLILHMKRRK